MPRPNTSTRRTPQAGDTFAVSLATDGFGAIRVLRVTIERTGPSSLVAVTTYRGAGPPELDDPALRTVLRRLRGRFTGEHAIAWYDGYPPSELQLVGTVSPTPAELALDPQGAYAGEWRLSMARDLELEDAWARGLDPTVVPRSLTGPRDEDIVSGEIDAAEFWQIIARLDWSGHTNDETLEPALTHLAAAPAPTIAGFQRALGEHLFALDAERFAREIGEGAYGTADHFSVDDFLYLRCAVVGNGAEFYARVLADPRQMPREVTFEPLLDLAERAYGRKTGRSVHFEGVPSVETFSNREGWPERTSESD